MGLLVCCPLSACVSGPQKTPEVLVVQRSELGRPRWLEGTLGIEPNAEKWFVHSSSDLLKLDLGIKQTQSSGLAMHCKLLAGRMRLEIQSALDQLKSDEKATPSGKGTAQTGSASSPSESGKPTAGQNEVIETALSKLADSQECPELEPKEVYWEELRRQTVEGPRSSYDVYVLLRLKQIDFDEVLAMTANSLKLSGRADLEKVAEILRGRMSSSPQRGTNE
ncbi:MAG: hypothetical protein RI953_1285 [Pseudomonadota bacterium]